MSNPTVLSLQLVAAVSNGIALSQTPAGAGNLTLNGSLATGGVATMDVARRVLISSAGADSAIVFTIKGTNQSGAAISSTVTGVASGAPVYSLADFKTVTSVAVSGATAGAITVGTNGVGSTVWGDLNFLSRYWAVGGGITGPAGTTYTLEVCYSDPNGIAGQGQIGAEQWSMSAGGLVPPHVYTYPGVSAATGDTQFNFADNPIFAARLTINSGTGLVTMEMIQAGIN